MSEDLFNALVFGVPLLIWAAFGYWHTARHEPFSR